MHAEFLAVYQKGEGHLALTVSMRLVTKSLEIRRAKIWTEFEDKVRWLSLLNMIVILQVPENNNDSLTT